MAFLRARLDHDELVAREAPSGPWRHAPTARHHATASGRSEEAVSGADAVCIATTGEGRQALVAAEHIARHDPARVLREVEAKREVVRQSVDLHAGDNPLVAYSAGVTLRALALPYADHPDYLAAWRP
ncbi:DUF6221 family protein [Streptomyces niveus]|uniref:DUF6221 family protein n=1 Tax=Streptomyces niveus TaxID=193462 RepID=UPI0036D7D149